LYELMDADGTVDEWSWFVFNKGMSLFWMCVTERLKERLTCHSSWVGTFGNDTSEMTITLWHYETVFSSSSGCVFCVFGQQ
jgi:hypothetical protein